MSILLAVYDKDGPQLYLVEPNGTMHVSSWQGGPCLGTDVLCCCCRRCCRRRCRRRCCPAHRPCPLPLLQRFFGAAVGKGRQGARNEIEKLKLEQMSCREGIKAVAKM